MALSKEKYEELRDMFNSSKQFLSNEQVERQANDPFIRSIQRSSGIKPEYKSFSERITERRNERGQNVLESIESQVAGEQGFGQTTFQTLGQGAGLVADTGIEAIRSAFRALPDFIEDPIRETGGKFIERQAKKPVGQAVLGTIEKISNELEDLEKENPPLARNIKALLNIVDVVATATGIGAAPKIARGGLTSAKGLLGKAKNLKISEVPLVSKAKDLSGRASERISSSIKRIAYEAEEAKDIRKRLDLATPEIRQVVNQGIDLNEANLVASSTKEEMSKLKEMMDLVKEQSVEEVVKRKSRSVVGEAVEREPRSVIGEAFLNRVKAIDNARHEAGKKLGELANKITMESVDITDDLLEGKNGLKKVKGLENLTLEMKDKTPVLDFSRTNISTDKPAQKLIQESFNEAVKRASAGDASQVHIWRQELWHKIFKKSLYKVSKNETIDEIAVNKIRQTLSDTLDNANDSYKELNKDYAVLENSLKNTRRNFRRVEDSDEDILELKAAQIMRRLTSNADADAKALLREVETVARQVGYSDGIDIGHLQKLLNVLDKYYKFTPTTGAQGQIAEGVSKALGGKSRLIQTGIEEGLKKVGAKPTEVTMRKAFEEFVNSL